MTDTNVARPPIVDLVSRVARPEADLFEVVRALRDEPLTLIPPKKLLGARPRPGLDARVFTTTDAARRYASAAGRDDGEAPIARAWLSALREFCADAYATLTVDDGGARHVELDQSAMKRLLEALERDHLAEAATLHAVTIDGQLQIEQRPDGYVYAYVYVDRSSATTAVERLTQYGPFGVAELARPELLRACRAGGVQRLKVDHGFENQYLLEPAVFIPLLGGTVEADELTPPPGSPDSTPTLAARVGPTPAPLPPPASDADSRRAFVLLKQQLDARAIDAWAFMDGLARQVSLHVPVASEAIEHLRWPHVQPVRLQSSDHEAAMVYVFTTKDRADAFVSQSADLGPIERLSAVEACRWIWAFPGTITHVSIDYPDAETWLTMPVNWTGELLLARGRPDGRAVVTQIAEAAGLWLGIGARADGTALVMHLPGDPRTGVLFTSEAGVDAFMREQRFGPYGEGDLAILRSRGRYARWFSSPLSVIAEAFPEAVVDPAPDGSGGTRFDAPALAAALDRQRELLQPRVPGFVVDW